MLTQTVLVLAGVVLLAGCATAVLAPGGGTQDDGILKGYARTSPKRDDKVVLTDAEWQKKLTPAQYKILRAQGTEAAFCGVFYDNHKTGVYRCGGCGLPLFASSAKFDSGTGWPSFFQPVDKKNIWLRHDSSYGMEREEVLCSRCDGHLGHVFDDAPQTKTGLRFCINSDALTFQEGDPAKLLKSGH